MAGGAIGATAGITVGPIGGTTGESAVEPNVVQADNMFGE
jgi:hypothetical protein